VHLSPRRKFIGYVVILIFILSFIPDPIKGLNLFDILKGFRFWREQKWMKNGIKLLTKSVEKLWKNGKILNYILATTWKY